MKKKKGIAVLGSTGSIGRQTLEVVEMLSDDFSISVLTSNKSHELLIEQALKFKPNAVVIADELLYPMVRSALENTDIKVFTGHNSIEQIVEMEEIDIVLNALVGFAGLAPTIKTLDTGKTLALANKESLVVAGDLIYDLTLEKAPNIIPVDSEHSAIFQCIAGEFDNPIDKVILTASGGPFRNKSIEFLNNATKTDALNHPNWSMGDKISIDSATMINKGFEIIEAKWLYNLKIEQIDVIIHPQSIIHSMVQFQDGSMKAQMSLPDMRLPIQYAMSYPNRLTNNFPRLNLLEYNSLTFEKPDPERFPNLSLAYAAIEKGGNLACILNASNEIAVNAFLKEQIRFQDIYSINEKSINEIDFVKKPSLDDYFEIDKETRTFAQNLI